MQIHFDSYTDVIGAGIQVELKYSLFISIKEICCQFLAAKYLKMYREMKTLSKIKQNFEENVFVRKFEFLIVLTWK